MRRKNPLPLAVVFLLVIGVFIVIYYYTSTQITPDTGPSEWVIETGYTIPEDVSLFIRRYMPPPLKQTTEEPTTEPPTTTKTVTVPATVEEPVAAPSTTTPPTTVPPTTKPVIQETTTEWEPVTVTPAKPEYEKVVLDVILGKYGNGELRKIRLKAAGYDYVAVQKEVNRVVGYEEQAVD